MHGCQIWVSASVLLVTSGYPLWVVHQHKVVGCSQGGQALQGCGIGGFWSRVGMYPTPKVKLNHYFVAIGNPEWHVRKASHRGSKQQ